MKKRILSILLCVLMVLSVMPVAAYAENASLTLTALDGTDGKDTAEGYAKLIDGTTSTKWCIQSFDKKGSAFVIFKASKSVCVVGYTLTTGNDNSSHKGRNPKSWVLYGCNDYSEANKSGGTWKAIHTVTNDTVLKDENKKAFDFSCKDNSESYIYYKLEIKETAGATLMQLSELSLKIAESVSSEDVYSVIYTDEGCEHEWRTNGITGDATCISQSFKEVVCTKCGATGRVGTGTAKLGHTHTGAGTQCTRCGRKNLIKLGDEFWLSSDKALKEDVDYENHKGYMYIYTSEKVGISNIDADVPVSYKEIRIKQSQESNVVVFGLNLYRGSIEYSLVCGEYNLIFEKGSRNIIHGKITMSAIDFSRTLNEEQNFGSLVISGEGELFCVGGYASDSTSTSAGAGIGAQAAHSTANITITGGIKVTAIGGKGAAGIGGGGRTGCDDYTENILIENATVTAIGNTKYVNTYPYSGAGIGGGMGGSAGNIKIKNSTVIAKGGYGAAGIGSGRGVGTPRNVTGIYIENSTVYATGGYAGAGIGGAVQANSVDTINIRNSDVTAIGGDRGAGIGVGAYVLDLEDKVVKNISISNSTVYAKGGNDGAGIGGTVKTVGVSDIYISYSNVTAQGGDNNVGIGSKYGSVSNIEINSASVVKAIGGRIGNCTAIGGMNGDVTGITIKNSTVTADGTAKRAIGTLSGTLKNVIIDGSSVKTVTSDSSVPIGDKNGKVQVTNSSSVPVYAITLPNPESYVVKYFTSGGEMFDYYIKNHIAADETDTNLYGYFPGDVTIKVGLTEFHAHVVNGEYKSFWEYACDESGHWEACTYTGCDKTKNKASHSFSNGFCTVCGYEEDVMFYYTLVSPQNGDPISKTVTKKVKYTDKVADNVGEVPFRIGYLPAGWSNEKKGTPLSEDSVCGEYTHVYNVWKTTDLVITATDGSNLTGAYTGTGTDYTYSTDGVLTVNNADHDITVKNNNGVESTTDRLNIDSNITLAGVHIKTDDFALIFKNNTCTLKKGTLNTLIGGGDATGAIMAINSSIYAIVTIDGEGGLILGDENNKYGVDIYGDLKITGGAITCNASGGLVSPDAQKVIITGGSVKTSFAEGIRPKNENGEDLYLLVIHNPDGLTVTVDGAVYNGTNHTAADPDDTNLYAWLPGRDCTVTVGGKVYKYKFVEGTFTDNKDILITSGETLIEGTDYTYVNGVLTILTDKPVTLRNSDSTSPSSDVIVVGKDVNANITLAGVNIDVSSSGGENDLPGNAAILIADDSNGNVTLTLKDGTENYLYGGYLASAITKNGKNGSLTINGNGSLKAQGGYGGAGIGSSGAFEAKEYKNTANITIESGNITAYGGGGAAGIGGGAGGNAYNIVINGGTVTAKCNDLRGGAGIGGGQYGSAYGITINDGTIVATGAGGSAGIGGGAEGGNAEDITINGGKVTAVAPAYGGIEGGAGIGGGAESSAGGGYAKNIKITGGTVIAYGYSSGIGGGAYGGNAENITITSGTVTASGELTEELSKLLFGTTEINNGMGAGIGGSGKSSRTAGTAENIVISGGSVNAIGGSYSNKKNNAAQNIGNGCGWTEKSTPTNANGEKVYSFVISNPKGYDVYIDGVKQSPSNHKEISGDTNLYLWLTGEKHTVKLGNETALYHFDSKTESFVKTDCYDKNSDHLCDLCGEKISEHVDKNLDTKCDICGKDFILYGDVNGDGEVTPSDVVLLRRYFANYDSETNTSTITVAPGADANGDGVLTPSDVVLLRRYFANYDSETDTSSIVLGK